MPVPPVKAFEYSLLVEWKSFDDEVWQTTHEYEHAYTAADAITQAELRWKHKDQCEKVYVSSVEPRHK